MSWDSFPKLRSGLLFIHVISNNVIFWKIEDHALKIFGGASAPPCPYGGPLMVSTRLFADDRNIFV